MRSFRVTKCDSTILHVPLNAPCRFCATFNTIPSHFVTVNMAAAVCFRSELLLHLFSPHPGSATVETATEEYLSNQNYNPMEPDIDPQADYGVVMPGSLPVTQNDPVPHFNPSPDVVQETYQV